MVSDVTVSKNTVCRVLSDLQNCVKSLQVSSRDNINKKKH